ncbi:MAG: hypothetical protein MJ078_01015 [Clostridia bacterium]|nr:hypothetical protein [Clostridia bacterium]
MEKKETKSQPAKTPSQPVRTQIEAYNGNEPYLFVSYSHKDTEEVFSILSALSEMKYRI